MAFYGQSKDRVLSFARDAKTVDTRSHLEALRKERENRSVLRKRVEAVTSIQSFARNLLDVRRQAEKFRSEFDTSLGGGDLQRLVALVHYFYEPRRADDNARLLLVVKQVSAAEADPDIAKRYSRPLGKAASAEDAFQFFAQVSRFLETCCQWLRNCSQPSDDDAEVIKLMVKLSTADLWVCHQDLLNKLQARLLSGSVFQALSAICYPLCLASDGSERGILESSMQLVENLLHEDVGTANTPMDVDGEPAPEGIGHGLFGLYILSLPNFLIKSRIEATSSVFTQAVSQIPKLLGSLDSTIVRTLQAEDRLFWLYSNLLSSCSKLDKSKLSTTAGALRTCLQCLEYLTTTWLPPVRLMQYTEGLPNQPNLALLTDTKFLQSIFATSLALDEALEPEPAPKPANPFAMGSSSNPFSMSSSSSSKASSSSTPTRQRGDRYTFPFVCVLYSALIKHALGSTKPGAKGYSSMSSARLNLLCPISYSPTLIPRIWKWLQKTGIKFEEEGKGSMESWLAAVIYVFCETYAYYLSCVDEETFYEKQVLFSIEANVTMSRELKEFVFNMHDNLKSDDALKTAAAILLKRMYELDSRQSFCPPGHWVAQRTEFWPMDIPLESLEDFIAGNAIQNHAIARTLTLLHHVPFLVPFDHRVLIFRNYIRRDWNRSSSPDMYWFGDNMRVRRDHLFEDAYSSMASMNTNSWKGRIKVEFISKQGMAEAGFGDGVTKEFLTSLCKTSFSEVYGLFLATPEKYMYPNPAAGSIVESPALKYQFLGKVLAKVIHEGILVDIPLARFFLNLLLSIPNNFSDLATLDADLHKNLSTLKHYDGNVQEDFGLNFTVVDEVYGEYKVRELIPNGKEIEVTNSNRMQYIRAIIHYRLTSQIRDHVAAFREGLSEIIDIHWLEMFNPFELQTLVGGADDEQELDVDDWANHTTYAGGYSKDHKTIKMFWEIIRGWSIERQRDLLKFTTSVSKAPLLGFKYMQPPFQIHMYVSVDGADRLPTAATCMSQLKLPPYQDKETLEQKMLYAIGSGSGFELS